MHRHQTWVLIPAYNEAQTISAVLLDLHAQRWSQILVVDDGSTDATSAIARAHGAGLLRLPQNSGQGAALAAGFRYLAATSAKIIVTFDADGQHHAADVAQLVQPIAAGQVDVVLGSRFLGTSDIPFWRSLVLKIGVIATRLLLRLRVTDTHNGLRAFGRAAFEAIEITDPRMGHASEILHQISRHRLRYIERAVTISYPSIHGSQPLSNSLGLAIGLLKLAVNRP